MLCVAMLARIIKETVKRRALLLFFSDVTMVTIATGAYPLSGKFSNNLV